MEHNNLDRRLAIWTVIFAAAMGLADCLTQMLNRGVLEARHAISAANIGWLDLRIGVPTGSDVETASIWQEGSEAWRS